MGSKLSLQLGAVGILLLLVGCASTEPEGWQRGRHYVWIPPKTGSNVGRWVAKDSGESKQKQLKQKEKVKAVAPAKVAVAKKQKPRPRNVGPEPSESSSPPDRFR